MRWNQYQFGRAKSSSTGGILLGILLPAGASAAELAAPQPFTVTVVNPNSPDATCYVTPKSGVSAVLVRLSPNTGGTPIGQINYGQTATASCSATSGGSYTACGGSHWWVGNVAWNGYHGYVAWACVNWYT